MPENKTIDLATQELNELVAIGDRLVGIAASADSAIKGRDLADIMAWVTRSGHLIRKVAGEGSAYDLAFVQARGTQGFSFIHSGNCEQISEIQGALKGLQHALGAGLLQDLRLFLQADIFADLLEMAEHLLSEGYKDAAAVLISGVLEDTLRKLSQANNLPLVGSNGKPLTIEPLNVNLAKADVFQPLTKKQITSWADLRNNAAHGDYGKYGVAEVREMLLFVQRFCADFMQ